MHVIVIILAYIGVCMCMWPLFCNVYTRINLLQGGRQDDGFIEETDPWYKASMHHRALSAELFTVLCIVIDIIMDQARFYWIKIGS